MDRYQFEDLISDYIENSLSLSKRKAFEAFLDAHPEEQSKVDGLLLLKNEMKKMGRVKTSQDFISELKTRIASENVRSAVAQKEQRTFFGFTPLYATLFGALIVILFVSGVQFFSTSNSGILLPGTSLPIAEENSPPPKYQVPSMKQDQIEMLADSQEDSLLDDSQPTRKQNDFNDDIQLVKNPR